jgi:hypothetical protein
MREMVIDRAMAGNRRRGRPEDSKARPMCLSLGEEPDALSRRTFVDGAHRLIH